MYYFHKYLVVCPDVSFQTRWMWIQLLDPEDILFNQPGSSVAMWLETTQSVGLGFYFPICWCSGCLVIDP